MPCPICQPVQLLCSSAELCAGLAGVRAEPEARDRAEEPGWRAVLVADLRCGRGEARAWIERNFRPGDGIAALVPPEGSPPGLRLDLEARDMEELVRGLPRLMELVTLEGEVQDRYALHEKLSSAIRDPRTMQLVEQLLGEHVALHNRLRTQIERANAETIAIVQSMVDALLVLDGDGRLLRANRAFRRMTGLDPQFVKGRPVEEFLLALPGEVIRPFAAFERRGTLRDYEARLMAPEGRTIPIAINASPVDEGGPSAVRSVWALRDLTKFRKLQEEHLQLSKMTAIGQLAGGIAHDFNNVLTVILGNTNLALTREADAGLVRESLREIQRASQHAAQLVSQLLALGRRQLIEPQVVDLLDLVNAFLPMLGRTIREDVRIDVEGGPGLRQVRADPTQMRQVIMNLVVNARDAMPRGGKVRIAVEDSREPELVGGRSRPETNWVRLTVADTGVGMDAETARRSFEPFFSTKEPGKGSGLGLAVVYGIVKQHGGEIQIRSESGKGTTFLIDLPAAEDAPSIVPAREESDPEGPGVSRSGARVLLVEDEESVRRLAHRILERFGYEVVSCSDPLEAQRLLRAGGTRFDLMLTDVVMPGLNGKDLYELARRSHPRLPVLFTSGHAETVLAQQGVRLTNVPFLPKPYTPSELIQKVEQALGSA